MTSQITPQMDFFGAPKLGPGHLATAEAARNYILAGNATFTLRSIKTGTRYTYKVTKLDEPNKSMWFVGLLTGPENEHDYQYMGIIVDGQFKLTKKSRFSQNTPSVLAFDWTFNQQLNKGKMPVGLEVWHEGRCGRCGRKLTVPESIALGLGPECAGRL